MAYSTKADILTEISEDKLIQLTDDEGAGVVDDARVTAAISKADALIDSYCGQVDQVPYTAPIPAVVKQHSITLSIYHLYARRDAIPETRQKAFDAAIAHLKDIAQGKASVGTVAVADVTASPKSSHTSEDRKITMGKTSDGSSGTLDNY
jgi:phage gp36-like protein